MTALKEKITPMGKLISLTLVTYVHVAICLLIDVKNYSVRIIQIKDLNMAVNFSIAKWFSTVVIKKIK